MTLLQHGPIPNGILILLENHVRISASAYGV